MKKIKIFSLFVCLAMLVIACHNDDDERGVQMRTVLVYIAGDNSLRSFATEDLAEMTEGMQSVDDNSYNLLVYIDTGSSPKLIRLKKDKKKNVVRHGLNRLIMSSLSMNFSIRQGVQEQSEASITIQEFRYT